MESIFESEVKSGSLIDCYSICFVRRENRYVKCPIEEHLFTLAFDGVHMMNNEFEHDHRHETISVEEKEDLLGLIHMRFGHIPEHVRQKIMGINDLDVLDRLFLIAVNAANWDVFVSELNEGKNSFKMVGDGFDPLAETNKKQE